MYISRISCWASQNSSDSNVWACKAIPPARYRTVPLLSSPSRNAIFNHRLTTRTPLLHFQNQILAFALASKSITPPRPCSLSVQYRKQVKISRLIAFDRSRWKYMWSLAGLPQMTAPNESIRLEETPKLDVLPEYVHFCVSSGLVDSFILRCVSRKLYIDEFIKELFSLQLWRVSIHFQAVAIVKSYSFYDATNENLNDYSDCEDVQSKNKDEDKHYDYCLIPVWTSPQSDILPFCRSPVLFVMSAALLFSLHPHQNTARIELRSPPSPSARPFLKARLTS